MLIFSETGSAGRLFGSAYTPQLLLGFEAIVANLIVGFLPLLLIVLETICLNFHVVIDYKRKNSQHFFLLALPPLFLCFFLGSM